MKTFKIIETLKKSFIQIKDDTFRYVLIIILAESMSLLLIKQIADRVFKIALFRANIIGITNENFWELLGSPTSLIFLIMSVLLIAIFILFQLTVIIKFANRPYENRKLGKNDFINPLRKIFSSQILLILVYIFLIMPNANIGLTTNITSNVHLPRFVVDAVLENPAGLIAYTSAIVLAFILNIRLFFTPVIFITRDELSFIESAKESWALTKKRSFKIFQLVTVITLLTSAITIAGVFLLSIPMALVPDTKIQVAKITGALSVSMIFFFLAFTISYSSIFTLQATVVAYHEILGEKPYLREKNFAPKKHHLLVNIVMVVVFIVFGVNVYLNTPSDALTSSTKVVSHRGESVKAIENTLESLQIASTYKPDYVEMDIQMTQDGHLVVFHDNTLKRLSKQSDNIHLLTLEEIQKVTLVHNGYESRIPTFDEYVAEAKKLNQPLMVELKTSKYDQDDFIEKMIATLDKYEMRPVTAFQSLDKTAILKLKELYPDTYTGYILGLNIGGLERLDVDFYSIEDSSISSRTLNDIERYNKDLFVWTVNEEDRMDLYLTMEVTGIITDHVEAAQNVIEDLKAATPFDRIYKDVLSSLK
ncbi:glycerophosphodiester phosphodiesterase [Erysipelothrix rhusiopathiae]|uniref:glycerophosphoryl diester phosphodiesterase membrane domain-containing protein n=1 Tax=Erysipelothrix rhusiopathiae TaxID=1648 RepID=UPI000210B461|nr:glycerophosphodiester phosphodiesterase [Erysipelothrix rhusiopathiae]AMS11805.1 glycerophosphodiester phosphodiesterase [Erysipelothrix rhusiopathiae]AOO68306.1 glycerophosphodiester phosphodiesterase [Erysipelothrix rhusiopathiae]AWU40846.1 glycerophosphodiester phosphodiesterase [Erysipelothrix rhusiopathiae]MDE8033156.1 glycerophosphodiester phosphodiesterase [Erysipelothrix rhusiopathiae]MDE8037210.1 glycerophosphodiester phosphodiesterase [Erysipelothrix rhusiopathiae]